ncbi:hypothetical protein L5515_017236 [Caenorhabditis briggsae]|uniref:Uncharacterized protein n=1 Tax=Caenorhabditis briggsae TaxID=6238 RepID=A0AAE9FEY9_CAEBR|nr:hypothetical protein L5515_017236 [Caenorhabditis briggsae]
MDVDRFFHHEEDFRTTRRRIWNAVRKQNDLEEAQKLQKIEAETAFRKMLIVLNDIELGAPIISWNKFCKKYTFPRIHFYLNIKFWVKLRQNQSRSCDASLRKKKTSLFQNQER